MTAKPTVVSVGDRFEDHARLGVVIELKGVRARVEWRDKPTATRRTWLKVRDLVRRHTRTASSGDLSARLARAEDEAARLRKFLDGDDSWAAMAMRYGAALERAFEALRSGSSRDLADAEVMCSDAFAGPSQQLGLLCGPDPFGALRAAVRDDEACLNVHRRLIRMFVEAMGDDVSGTLAVEEPTVVEFIRWIREWDPACAAAHDWVYNGGAWPEAGPYTDEQLTVIREHVDAFRYTKGRLGFTRAIEIRTLVSLLDGDFARRVGTDAVAPSATERSRLSNYIRESQANVMLPREGGAES